MLKGVARKLMLKLTASLSLAAVTLLVAALFVVAPSTTEADPIVPGDEHCVVNVRTDDALNIRSRPTSRSRVEGRKRYGECGIFVRRPCSGNWCPVEDGHIVGWAHRHFLAAISPARYCVTGVAFGDVLNVRAYPSPQSRVLTRLGRRQCGISFLPYSVGNWQKIRVGGWQGWVNRRYVTGQ
jgi:SH3-like domain-containing protein